MEKLEGKYFEGTITALQKVKKAENIVVPVEFKNKLRASLLEKASVTPVKDGFDWSDFILRYKYIFGGVPVLAALVIVAINFSALQVELPTNQIVPDQIADQNNSSNDNPSMKSGLADNQLDTKPGIVTFPAEWAMPPAEVLEKNRVSLEKTGFSEEQISQPVSKIINSVGEQIKLNIPKIEVKGFDFNDLPLFTGEKTSNLFSTTPVVENQSQLEESGKVVNDVTSRSEDSGKLEENGVLPLNNSDVVNTSLVNTIAPESQQISLKSLSITPLTVEELSYNQFQQTIVPGETLDLGKGTDLLNVQQTNELSLTRDLVEPVTFDVQRIYYDGRDREIVVPAAMEGLSRENVQLSSDYYIQIGLLEEGIYKVLLYNNGQVKTILVLARDERGNLNVVNRFSY